MDNVSSLLTQANTPKVPKPAMVPPVRLNTNIDVEPQVDNVRRNERSNVEFINKNISDSNIATAMKISSGNQATSAINKIRSDELNTELDLQNKERQSNIYPNLYNTRAINDYTSQNMMRNLGINQAINRNIDNFSRDLIDKQDKDRFADRDRRRMNIQLAMDTEGSLSEIVKSGGFDDIITNPTFDPTKLSKANLDAYYTRMGQLKIKDNGRTR
jgi:hypothetical protein